jgi:hypothetical protein
MYDLKLEFEEENDYYPLSVFFIPFHEAKEG